MSDTQDTGEYAPRSLADILNPSVTFEAPSEPAGQAEPEPQTEAEPETGDTTQAVPPTAETDPPHVPIAALKDERSKRQALEAQVSEMQRQLEALKATPATPVEPPKPAEIPNPATDPAAYHRYVQGSIINERLNTSQMIAAEKYPDLDAAIDTFQAMAKADPSLFDKLYAQPNPYEWAYREVKKHEALKDLGDDPMAFRKKLEAEIRAQIAAETPKTPPVQLPDTLATARSVGTRTADAWSGPTPLNKIVRFQG